MRIGTYNVEWFDRLFDNEGNLIDDDGWSSRWGVTRAQQTAALGHVFSAMDLDVVMVIEAPDSSRKRDGALALENFAARFNLRTRKAVVGFKNDTQQEIALLYDPDVVSAVHDPIGEPTGKKGSSKAPRFDGVFRIDVNTDASPELITWSKPPLEVALKIPTGRVIRLIGVHAKSKAPHGAQNDAEARTMSIENRRKQLAQCIWLRQRVDSHLAAGDDLIVLGDFNDGPGLDEYEALFGRSSIEVVLGEADALQLFEPHARIALGRRMGAMPSTSRFKRRDKPYLNALLDYVMVSPSLHKLEPDWQIWHPFDHPECYKDVPLREALLTASDHFPVVMELTV
ncbi:MAG: putative extracellular nuclease [Yoonia sp.]|jgi:predicted extracellular nuclease